MQISTYCANPTLPVQQSFYTSKTPHKWVMFMEKKPLVNVLRIVEIDREISRLHMDIMRLERERVRLDKTILNELYEEEQTI